MEAQAEKTRFQEIRPAVRCRYRLPTWRLSHRQMRRGNCTGALLRAGAMRLCSGGNGISGACLDRNADAHVWCHLSGQRLPHAANLLRWCVPDPQRRLLDCSRAPPKMELGPIMLPRGCGKVCGWGAVQDFHDGVVEEHCHHAEYRVGKKRTSRTRHRSLGAVARRGRATSSPGLC